MVVGCRLSVSFFSPFLFFQEDSTEKCSMWYVVGKYEPTYCNQ